MLKKEIVIEIDAIKSGKANIISFYRKNKLIDRAPLRLKDKSEAYNYHYRHHFDGDDLQKINSKQSSIVPYAGQGAINEWTSETKSSLKKLIIDGKFNRIFTKGNTKYNIKLVWVPAE
ncbi:hypothetical protein EKG37_06860 [Robertmurraya yapensis]|uniref:Uncharacterized protein n=2 Tax=Bacillaceae TaxID=186817 RepID=A0A431WF31_9BACI|nr:hypothetical protein [Bacillus yapensis]RTR33928.1 hypothetical protein EKG37_06860 [Bacillus yapensis]TKS97246.1 hypothetical protein FAR12_06860 [Bacillus yapensis]